MVLVVMAQICNCQYYCLDCNSRCIVNTATDTVEFTFILILKIVLTNKHCYVMSRRHGNYNLAVVTMADQGVCLYSTLHI